MIKIKRPIFVCTIGSLIGIIYGLYFEKSIALIVVLVLSIYSLIIFCNKKNMFYYKNTVRYLKVFLNYKSIICLCISAILFNSYIIYLNDTYQKVYELNNENINATAVIISDKQEKEYSYTYTARIKSGMYKNKKFILTLKKDERNIYKYGDLISFNGIYIAPSKRRNYQGFDYSLYLKSINIYGTIKIDNSQFIRNKDLNILLIESFNIRNAIIKASNNLLNEENSNLFVGLILGDKTNISDDTINSFKNSNLMHILAVSGMHISYIILRNIFYIK